MSEKCKTERLADLCAEHTGEHYLSTRWKQAADAEDWIDHWPIVDASGNLTGAVVETGSCDGMANVDDDAMIRINDLPWEERRRVQREQKSDEWDGYANI